MTFEEFQIARNHLKNALMSSAIKFKESSEYINVHCPHCDDSHPKNASKAGRGFFLHFQSGTDWVFYYKCHNGGCDYNKTMSIFPYLKKHHFRHFEALRNELRAGKQIVFSPNGTISVPKNEMNGFEDWKKKEEEWKIQAEKELEEHKAKERENLKYFVPIEENTGFDEYLQIQNDAIKYCKSRMLPKSVWKTFFVGVGKKYHGRLIVPFMDSNDKPLTFSARALYGQEPKYLNWIGDKHVYGLALVDVNKPIIIFEGAIDSMFFPNAVAMGGISDGNSEFGKLPKDKMFYLFDNDAAGKKVGRKKIRSGETVFSWMLFFKDFPNLENNVKDWNDVVLATKKTEWKFSDIEKYFVSGGFKEHLI